MGLIGIRPSYGHSIVGVTAATDNQLLIGNLHVDYSNPASIATLDLKPIADQFGTATITVTVQDDGPNGSNTFSRNFAMKVNSVNDPPTFNHLMVNYSSRDETPQTHGPAIGADGSRLGNEDQRRGRRMRPGRS